MVLLVLLHGAAESWAFSRTQLSRLETLHNSRLRCITRDTVGRPNSISTKDLMEKTHQLPSRVMIKERGLRWLGHAAHRPDNNMVKQLLFATRYPDMCNLLDGLVALGCIMHLCYEGCEGHGTANGLPQPSRKKPLGIRSRVQCPGPA